mmetsp:Transcript_117670/g.327639  ORF Transcript_117670/g.327639 Transcript_117670/m.327639 type:complete len:243 (-) Transcript_117670:1369-2097(-)
MPVLGVDQMVRGLGGPRRSECPHCVHARHLAAGLCCFVPQQLGQLVHCHLPLACCGLLLGTAAGRAVAGPARGCPGAGGGRRRLRPRELRGRLARHGGGLALGAARRPPVGAGCHGPLVRHPGLSELAQVLRPRLGGDLRGAAGQANHWHLPGLPGLAALHNGRPCQRVCCAAKGAARVDCGLSPHGPEQASLHHVAPEDPRPHDGKARPFLLGDNAVRKYRPEPGHRGNCLHRGYPHKLNR